MWQQAQDGSFQLEKGAFDAVLIQHGSPDISQLEFNFDQTLLASIVADNPQTVWIWEPEHSDVHTVITFQHTIRQILWHPLLPNVLLVLCQQKDLILYGWYSQTRAPASINVVLEDSASSKVGMSWLGNASANRLALMLSSSKAFSIGTLAIVNDQISYEVLSWHTEAGHTSDRDITEIDTPSKRG